MGWWCRYWSAASGHRRLLAGGDDRDLEVGGPRLHGPVPVASRPRPVQTDRQDRRLPMGGEQALGQFPRHVDCLVTAHAADDTGVRTVPAGVARPRGGEAGWPAARPRGGWYGSPR